VLEYPGTMRRALNTEDTEVHRVGLRLEGDKAINRKGRYGALRSLRSTVQWCSTPDPSPRWRVRAVFGMMLSKLSRNACSQRDDAITCICVTRFDGRDVGLASAAREAAGIIRGRKSLR
jgi:hypothetical protein